MKLYTVINLAVQLNCRCACNGQWLRQWQRQRCRRRCSKRARNFRNFLIAANALHKWESRGAEEGKRGTALKGLLLKWKTSQKHISRTPRELHKKRKRFSALFFCAGSAFDAILWSTFMAAGQTRSKRGRQLALHSRLQAGKAEQTTHEILDWASLPLYRLRARSGQHAL